MCATYTACLSITYIHTWPCAGNVWFISRHVRFLCPSWIFLAAQENIYVCFFNLCVWMEPWGWGMHGNDPVRSERTTFHRIHVKCRPALPTEESISGRTSSPVWLIANANGPKKTIFLVMYGHRTFSKEHPKNFYLLPLFKLHTSHWIENWFHFEFLSMRVTQIEK